MKIKSIESHLAKIIGTYGMLYNERNNRVKKSKINMVVHQYELFKRLSNESITSIAL